MKIGILRCFQITACVVIILTCLTSCDYETSGRISNYTGNEIEIVISPYLEIHEFPINNMGNISLGTKSTADTAYFLLVDGGSVVVAGGINGLAPDDFRFAYLKVSTLSDTLILESKNEIFKMFRTFSQEDYRFELR